MEASRRIVIVSQGEDVPSDEGYVPLRYGRLAEWLTERGHDVLRISPSFSHFRKAQRAVGVERSDEGRHVVVETTSYESSVSRARASFTRQLLSAVHSQLKAEGDGLDAVLVGLPPPGSVVAARSAVGRSVPILADVRDLWPDAFAVGERQKFERSAARVGRVISQETRLANRVTAVTGPMLEWVPVSKRHAMIPIGMGTRELVPERLPAEHAPLRACFLSNHTHGFNFAPVIDGWRSYTASLSSPEDARLIFVGAPPSDPVITRAEAGSASIEFVGKIVPAAVPELLSSCDIGLAPSLPEWSMSVGNKIFDYLALGLIVLHTIDPSETSRFDAAGLGRRMTSSPDSWSTAFKELHENRVEIRATRARRIDEAQQMFGASTTTAELADALLGMIA